MKAYVAVTDKGWFEHLRTLSCNGPVQEVNFWTPRKWGGQFRVLERGQPLLFKLKRPDNAIVGGGFYEHYSELPISLAWQSFGEKNGASSLAEIRSRTALLRRDNPRPWEDYTIGCILLAEPFFWDEKDWIPQPADWAPSTQRGKGYDLRAEIGRTLWAQVFDRLRGTIVSEPKPPSWLDLPGGYGDPVPVRPRVGQGIFRTVVADVYGRQCAVTREKAFPALEAAHIRPFKEEPQHYVKNGLAAALRHPQAVRCRLRDGHAGLRARGKPPHPHGLRRWGVLLRPQRDKAVESQEFRTSAGPRAPGVAQRESVPGVR